MAKDLMPLEALGKNVEGALGAYATEREHAVDAARRTFLRAALRGPSGQGHRGRTLLLAAAALALLVGVTFVATRPRALAFTADGAATAPETWIAAPANRPVSLAFSDGTKLSIEPSSRARVVAIDERGASIALESGALQADVVHRSESAWRVIAGPLTVRVTGTRFELRWLASTEEFSLSVKQGSVSVSGPALERPQSVRAGESLRVFVAEKRFVLANGRAKPEPLPAQSAGTASEPASSSPEHIGMRPPALDASAVSEGAPRDDWRELARRGLLKKAFAAAEAGDFDAACRMASAAELLQLGDGARLSGRANRANQALIALRTRFPSDPRRSAAAFALGKVAFDLTGSYAQAAEWFSTSIREQPSGSLAREAAGRLIEAYRSAGNTALAERAARDYLDRHPNGPHADVARSVVR